MRRGAQKGRDAKRERREANCEKEASAAKEAKNAKRHLFYPFTLNSLFLTLHSSPSALSPAASLDAWAKAP